MSSGPLASTRRKKSASGHLETAWRVGRTKRASVGVSQAWRVADDWPAYVPVSERELDVIERRIVAACDADLGCSKAIRTRPTPSDAKSGENPETKSHKEGHYERHHT